MKTNEKTATGWIKHLHLRNDEQRVFWTTSLQYPNTLGMLTGKSVDDWHYSQFVQAIKQQGSDLDYAQVLANPLLKTEFDRYWNLTSETRLAIDRFIMQAELSYWQVKLDLFWEQLRDGLRSKFSNFGLPIFYLGKITVNNGYWQVRNLGLSSLFWNSDKNFYQLSTLAKSQLWKLFATSASVENILSIIEQKWQTVLISFWNKIKFFFNNNKDFATAELFLRKLIRYFGSDYRGGAILASNVENSLVNRLNRPVVDWTATDWSNLESLLAMQLQRQDRWRCLSDYTPLSNQAFAWSPHLWTNWKNRSCSHKLPTLKFDFLAKRQLFNEINLEGKYLHRSVSSPFFKRLHKIGEIDLLQGLQLFRSWKNAQLSHLWTSIRSYLYWRYFGFPFEKLIFTAPAYEVVKKDDWGELIIKTTLNTTNNYQIATLFDEIRQSNWNSLSLQAKTQLEQLFNVGLNQENLKTALQQQKFLYINQWSKLRDFLVHDYRGFAFSFLKAKSNLYPVGQLFANKSVSDWQNLAYVAKKQLQSLILDAIDWEVIFAKMNDQRLTEVWKAIKPIFFNDRYAASLFSQPLLIKGLFFNLDQLLAQKSNLQFAVSDLTWATRNQLQDLSNAQISLADLEFVLDGKTYLEQMRTKWNGTVSPVLSNFSSSSSSFSFHKVVIQKSKTYSLKNLFAEQKNGFLSDYFYNLNRSPVGYLSPDNTTNAQYLAIVESQKELINLLVDKVSRVDLSDALVQKRWRHLEFWQEVDYFTQTHHSSLFIDRVTINQKTYWIDNFFDPRYIKEPWHRLPNGIKTQIEIFINDGIDGKTFRKALSTNL